MNPVQLVKRVLLAVVPFNPYNATGARIVIPIRPEVADLCTRATHDTLMRAVANACAAFESTVGEHTLSTDPRAPQPYVE